MLSLKHVDYSLFETQPQITLKSEQQTGIKRRGQSIWKNMHARVAEMQAEDFHFLADILGSGSPALTLDMHIFILNHLWIYLCDVPC